MNVSSAALVLLCCAAPAADPEATIRVDARAVTQHVGRHLAGACIEDVNHEIYGGLYSQMVFGESFQEPPARDQVSGMWRPLRRGTARGDFALLTERPFAERQSQTVAFTAGDGEVGVEDRGLNRQGMCFRAGKPYEGYVWARAAKPADLWVALESGDGARVHAETKVRVAADEWRRLAFTLTPAAEDPAGRLALKLKEPGAVVLGHVFLQPGEWGRFKGLPVRKDVVEGMVAQKLTVLRYGGSMVNDPDYRWKKMIGPRDRRPPYTGTWYRYSTNGWGILDFLDLCEAAGFLGIPAFYLGETARDMADFVEYVNGPADSEWGRKRAADGHPRPYGLRYLELGNEERIDDKYYEHFRELAEAIWARDPKIIPVVGDFAYGQPIRDPDHISGAASRVTSLAGHRRILELAKKHDREVWFDVHLDTEGPTASGTLRALPSYVEALDKIAGGAKHKVVIFELNANNHSLRRALGNAVALNAIERLGDRVPIVCSANGLQVDGQNDNGWNQGLLFMNPCKVWPQPPYFVTQMFAAHSLPLCVKAEVRGPADVLDVTATRDEDGKSLRLQVVNVGARPIEARVRVDGFRPGKPVAQVVELSGKLDDVNTATDPQRVAPRTREWRHGWTDGGARYTFPAHSFTVLRLE